MQEGEYQVPHQVALPVVRVLDLALVASLLVSLPQLLSFELASAVVFDLPSFQQVAPFPPVVSQATPAHQLPASTSPDYRPKPWEVSLRGVPLPFPAPCVSSTCG